MEKQELKPAGVFKYFAEICQVPRPSKKEEKIIAYLKAFGEKHNLETKVDEAGHAGKGESANCHFAITRGYGLRKE